MQPKKVYHVSLFLDLHAVSCPGVWLCPKGKVGVRVAIFGVSEITKKLTPSFPLFFHERFHFQKKYKKASNLHQVERVLHRSPVVLELLQYPHGTTECVKLAEFKATVGDIIYPPGGDMDLLFRTTDTFPGIIGPKGEVTTQLTLTEGGIKDNFAKPTTVLSKGTKGKQIEEPVIRQKPVCHTKHYLYCGCFDKNAPPRMLAKAMRMRKDLLTKNRTRSQITEGGTTILSYVPSQEAIRQSRAHIRSHKNHGDFLKDLGYEEQSDDGDEVKFGKCSCCYQEQAFRATSPSIHAPSEKSSVKGKNMKDGYTTPTGPKPMCYACKGYKPGKDVEEAENIPSEKPASPPQKGEGQCCLCCPRAPGHVMKRKSSAEMFKNQETQPNPEEEKYQYYPMEVKKYQEYPMDEYRSTPYEVKMNQPNPLEKKKDLRSTCCPLCDRNNTLMKMFRKKCEDKPKEENEQNLFDSNLCKAYQRLMHEFYMKPPGDNSLSYVNRPGTF